MFQFFGFAGILAALVSIPLISNILENKLNFQISGISRFLTVFFLVTLAMFTLIQSMLVANDSVEPKTEMYINKDPIAEMNISKTPDEIPLVEYHVSAPYSPEMDSWMKAYAQKHRTSSKEELHLFTFSDREQFEYNLPGAGSRNEGTLSSASWVEESSNEMLKPTKIDMQQFQRNMQSILIYYNDSYYELKLDNTSGEILYVHLGKILEILEDTDKASILKIISI